MTILSDIQLCLQLLKILKQISINPSFASSYKEQKRSINEFLSIFCLSILFDMN